MKMGRVRACCRCVDVKVLGNDMMADGLLGFLYLGNAAPQYSILNTPPQTVRDLRT